MRRTLVVGNWKMHGDKEQVRLLTGDLEAGLKASTLNVEIVVCPTFLHLGLVAEIVQSRVIKLGAQDGFAETSGAHTGEVSMAMLAEYGVEYVIVGHSERRGLLGETDQLIAKKFVAAQSNKLIPILCVGESIEQRQQGVTEQVILEQLDAVIERAGVAALNKGVIAYEPVWAIGTGQTATPAQAQQVHHFLREYISKLDQRVAANVRIIYGGSVNSSNAGALFAKADIDGGLVGGASLQAEEFISICTSAD